MAFFLQQTLSGVVLGMTYALFALGLSLVLAHMDVFHVAHEAIFAVGAIIAWMGMVGAGLPLVPAALIAIVGAAALNGALYLVAIRPIARGPDSQLLGFVSSMGVLIALTGVNEIILNQKTVRLPFDAFPIAAWQVGPLTVTTLHLALLGASVLTLLAVTWMIEGTQLGREIVTSAYDPELASLLGVNVEKVVIVVFLVSGAAGGMSAVLLAIAFNVIGATMGETYMLTAIAIMVIGGFGSVKGVVVAGLLVGLLSAYITAYWTSAFRDVAVFAVMIGFLIVRPTGLFRVPKAEARA